MANKRNIIIDRTLDWVRIVSKLIVWICGSIIIYWLILKITGHSPTTDQVLISTMGILGMLQIATLTLLIKFMIDMSSFRGHTEHHIKECDRRFYALAKDFKNTDSEFRKHMMKYHKVRYS